MNHQVGGIIRTIDNRQNGVFRDNESTARQAIAKEHSKYEEMKSTRKVMPINDDRFIITGGQKPYNIRIMSKQDTCGNASCNVKCSKCVESNLCHHQIKAGSILISGCSIRILIKFYILSFVNYQVNSLKFYSNYT